MNPASRLLCRVASAMGAFLLLLAPGLFGQNLSLSPSNQNLFATGTQQFTALLSGQPTTSVTWSINPTTGTISTSGLYAAPLVVPTQTTVTVKAVLTSNTSITATATVTLGPITMSISPSSQNLNACQTQQYTAQVNNNPNTTVTWGINPNVGSINTSGVYTAPGSITTQQNIVVTATSVADPTKSISSSATLHPSTGSCAAVSVSVSPAAANVYGGQTQQFTATVSNTSNTTVAWTLNSGAPGSINSSGLYTAPATVVTQTPVTVMATSQADTTKSATATITLYPPVTITASPTAVVLYGGQTQQFTANSVNPTSTIALWTLNSGAPGSISTSGLYTAPATVTATTIVTVTATSQADSTKSATAVITLYPPVTISVAPTTVTMYGGQTQQFTASSTNPTSASAAWTLNTGAPGSVSTSGVYTAPATVTTTTTVIATATSQVDGTKSATATITLYPPATITVAPTTATLYGGQTQQFTASSTNPASTTAIWSINTGALGSVSTSGLYTAPTAVTTQTTVVVTATNQADNTKTATATITLYPPVTISAAPTTVTLYGGQTQQFTATAGNPAGSTATWSLNTGAPGSISTSGLYTAPATVTTTTTVIVTATSQVDTTKSVSATITLEPPLTITLAPTTVTLTIGQTQQFTTTITNATNTGVNWLINPSIGTISTGGLYAAPATLSGTQTVVITATSQADPTRTATATVTLSAVTVTATPATATLTAGQTQPFMAAVQGSPNSNVTWSIQPTTGAGTISSNGIYLAPPCVTSQQIVTITATSQADSTKTSSATVTLQYIGGFGYRRAIVINHNNVPNTDQTNFPVLISSTDSTLASVLNGGHVANTNGYDLVFTGDSTCATKLNYEVESWNSTTGQLTAWVQVPLLSHTADTPIYMCYGNPSITTDQSNRSGAWDSGYQAVLHLGGGTALSALDSTANGRNGTINGSTLTTGKVGGAANFSGSGQYIEIGNMGTRPTQGTISMWVNAPALANYPNAFTTGPLDTACGNAAIRFELHSDGYFGANTGADNADCGSNYAGPAFTTAFTPNAWHYVTVTWDSSQNQLTTYYDGNPSLPVSDTFWPSTFNDVKIGVGWDISRSWTGQIEEARMSSVKRSADWIATEFANQNAVSTFYTLLSENAAINVTPPTSYLYVNQTQQFGAIASSCASPAVTWSIPASAPGTITPGGLYTAPPSITATQAVAITATSQADGTTAGTATVNLFPPIGVSVSPTSVLMTNGLTQQFTATLANATNNAVIWTVNPTGSGSISLTGLYTAPTTVTTTQTATVTATSVTDNTKSGSASIKLIAQVSAPAFSIPSGLYGSPQQVALTSASPYAAIRYTVDGTTPTETSGTLYSGSIPVSSKVMINAIAYQYGFADSSVSTAAYTFTATTGSARFITTNTTTQGNWIGLYGKDGYYIPGLVNNNFPGYLTLGYPATHFDNVEVSSTYDVRAVQKPAPASDRIASQAYANNGSFTNPWDLNFTDGQVHQIAIYFLDWTSSSDIQQVTIRDAGTQAILDTRVAQTFFNGEYLVWTVSGHVQVQFQNISNNGSAYYSALFFDPPTVTVSPLTSTLSPGQTQQFSAQVGTSSNQNVNWSINPAGVGLISTAGLYTAPISVVAQQSVTVIATSQANPATFGTATVTLLPGIGDGLMQAMNIIVKSLCRDPHAGPVVSAGADQLAYIGGYNGVKPPPNSAIAYLTGTALSYTLNPGDSLTYGWSVVTGPGTVQFSAPNSTTPFATFTVPGTYTLQFTANDGIVTSAAQTHVTVAAAPVGNGNSFVITPTTTGPVAVGATVTVGLQVYGFFAGNGSIQLQVSGANPQSATVFTDANGTAGFSYGAANPGVDTISGTAVGSCCTGPITSNVATVTVISTPAKLTTSPVTAQFFPADSTGVFNTPPTQTPAFTQVFPVIDFDPAAGVISGNTSGVTNQTRPFTDVVTDRNGNFAATLIAQGTDYQAGVGAMYAFSTVFTGVLNVPSAGPVTFSITSDDGFMFGIGNGATRVSGPQINTPAATPFNNYSVMGGVNQREDTSASTITVNFPAAGAYPYELDYAKGGDKNLTLIMKANGASIPAATLLTLTPSIVPSTAGGQVVQFVLSATDADGKALQSVPVTFLVTGENPQTRQVTTDAAGNAGFAYAGAKDLFGTDTIQAAAFLNGSNVYSNAVTMYWNNGVNQAPVVSAGTNQTINLPSQAVLNGSVSDDGLPNNTLTITWSMQTGPAPVVFDDPAQAATAATFSTAGTYVLLLTATDGALTSTSTVTVTVTQATTWNSGWLASPLNASTVSGQVPVTLISGITLTGGTLTFYPANNQSAVTTISAGTTGTGQIGIFDTTLLNNGSYFVELYATNSLGVTQTNLALVTVAGNYKPGRVTATVTDFTVPSAGLAIQVQRTYDSLVRSQSNDFGYGWQLGLNAVNLTVSTSGDVTLTISGQRHTFYFTPSSTIIPSYYVPQYTAEPGFYGSMSNTGDNCNGVLLPIGNVYQCGLNNAGSVYQASGYTYTDPYGRVYTLSPTGALQSLKDLNGNTLTLSATGITSSTGLNIPFVRDTQGRITQITDAVGNLYKYAYDTNGNLSTVTFPSIATPTTYGYDPTHLLTSEQDPRGNTGSTTYYPNGQVQYIIDAANQKTSYVYNVTANTTTVTNPDGGTVTTVTDAYGMPLTVTDPLGRVTTNTYDTNHNLLTSTDPLGKTTIYTYDSNGFRTSTEDPLGDTWTLVNNQVGGVTSMTDPLGQTRSFTYDANFNLLTASDPIGQIAGLTENALGLPLTLKDANGNTSNYAYDQFGNRTRYTDALSRTTTDTYNNMGWASSETDPRGNVTKFGFDSLGRKTSMTDAYLNVTQYTYDENNNKISETDALLRTISYTYDNVNRMTGIRYPDSTTKSYTYDFRDNKLTETDQLGHVTKSVYDLAGQLTSSTVAFGTPDAAVTSYTYDFDGRRLTQTDPNGNDVHYAYDAAGRMTSMTDGIGNAVNYGYDAKGQRTSMTDAKNRKTNYTYDVRGRQLTTSTPDTKTVLKTYDGVGSVLTVTDEEDRITTYVYDAVRQPYQVKDALNQITQYGYDLSGNKTSQMDANGHTAAYAYDNLNRRTMRTLPAGQMETTSYDVVGNKTSITDFNGKTTIYAYDSLNRLLSRTPDISFSAPPVTFTYTSTGKRATMSDVAGSTTYSYTNRDQVLSKVTPQGTLSYTYDPFGDVLSVISSNASGTNTAYAWDADNRLQSVTDNRTNGVTNYTYDQTSQLATMQYPNGVAHVFTYDVRDRTIGLNVNGSAAAITSYTQTFGSSGHKLTIAEGSGRNVGYSYDSVYRLATESIASDPTAANNGGLTYSLDPVGNRQSLTSTLTALPAQTFTYDADDRLSSDTYDANGNTITSGGVTYRYDFEDRLLSTSSGVQITYDGDGNRVSETVGGVTTKYLVDDLTPTHYAQVAEEIGSGLVSVQFTYGVVRISQNRAGTVSYYGYDAGGSVRQLVNSAGAVTDTYAYDAFGNTIAQSGSTVNEFLYRGEQYDGSLGAYYLRARYYRPQLGRFLSQDKYEGQEEGWACDCSNRSGLMRPIGTHHLFAYANVDPIDQVDPTGLDPWITYAQLRRIIVGMGLEAHHLIEKRFLTIMLTVACLADLAASIPLSPADHQAMTNAWRQRFPYGEACATAQEVIDFALQYYKGRPEVIAWLKATFKQ